MRGAPERLPGRSYPQRTRDVLWRLARPPAERPVRLRYKHRALSSGALSLVQMPKGSSIGSERACSMKAFRYSGSFSESRRPR